MYRAIGVEPTKLTARRRGVEHRVDGHLVAVHDVEDAGGKARLLDRRARKSAADGSFSLGLSTTVLPQAMAMPSSTAAPSPGS
jgi:hypothetical protein